MPHSPTYCSPLSKIQTKTNTLFHSFINAVKPKTNNTHIEKGGFKIHGRVIGKTKNFGEKNLFHSKKKTVKNIHEGFVMH